MKLITTLNDGTKIIEVDGSYIRHNIDVEFMQGGHGYVYKYIPKDQIWVEKMLSSDDQEHNLKHEVREYMLMRYDRFKYARAHKMVLKIELAERRNCRK